MYYYVYRITCIHPQSLEKYYYGYRSTSKLPSEDVYWSSSKYVLDAIRKYGKQSFKKKILRRFNDKNSAMSFEMKLHEKFSVDINPIFFNKCKSTKWGFNCTGAILKGKTYEEIMGVEKATKLRAIRSLASKGKNNKGINNPMYGRKHTDEMKTKLSAGRQGKLHPAYGMRWITDGIVSMKIRPADEIPINWYYGRRVPRKKKVA